jgi:inorganic pyrophosphatase
MWAELRDVADIPTALRAEIEQFFKVYKELDGEPTHSAGFGSRAEALQAIDEAAARSIRTGPRRDSPKEMSA